MLRKSNKMCKCCSKHDVHNGGSKCMVKDHIMASQALLTVTVTGVMRDAVTENHEESWRWTKREIWNQWTAWSRLVIIKCYL